VIIAKHLSKANKYVRSVTFNGKRVEGFVFKHADLMAGGELVFDMRGPDETSKVSAEPGVRKTRRIADGMDAK